MVFSMISIPLLCLYGLQSTDDALWDALKRVQLSSYVASMPGGSGYDEKYRYDDVLH
jgi:ABC-type multidrug transport system fused ATPase/permease subunit